MATFDQVADAFCRQAARRLEPVTHLGRTQRRHRLALTGKVVSALLGVDVQLRLPRCVFEEDAGPVMWLLAVCLFNRHKGWTVFGSESARQGMPKAWIARIHGGILE